MSADEDIDLEDVVSVNEWSVAKIVMVDEDGAAEAVYVEMIDTETEEAHRFLLHCQNACWLAWGLVGSAHGFLGAYSTFSQSDRD